MPFPRRVIITTVLFHNIIGHLMLIKDTISYEYHNINFISKYNFLNLFDTRSISFLCVFLTFQEMVHGMVSTLENEYRNMYIPTIHNI